MTDPPFWDSAWTTAAGAATLDRTNLDVVGLIQAPEFVDAGPGTHGTSLYTWISGAILRATDPPSWLLILHFVSIGIGAALVVTTFDILRCQTTTSIALLGAAIMLTHPIILQQVADPYLDLPLALLAVLAVRATLDDKPNRLTAYCAVAVAIKPAGLALLGALPLLHGRSKPGRTLLPQLTVRVVVASSPALVFLVRQIAYAERPLVGDDSVALLQLSLVNMARVPDILLLTSFALWIGWRARSIRKEMIRPIGAILVSFAALYFYAIVIANTIAFLPRYAVMVMPLVVILALTALDSHSRSLATYFGVILLVFGVLNSHGLLYPQPNRPSPTMAERTLAGQTYLDLQMATTSALANAQVEILAVDMHMLFRLTYPEFGYVDYEISPPLVLAQDLGRSLPASFAWAREPHTGEMDRTLTEYARRNGYRLKRSVIFEGRWTSELVIATRASP